MSHLIQGGAFGTESGPIQDLVAGSQMTCYVISWIGITWNQTILTEEDQGISTYTTMEDFDVMIPSACQKKEIDLIGPLI